MIFILEQWNFQLYTGNSMVGRSWMDVGMIFYQFFQELMVYMFLCCRCGMNKYLIDQI